MRNRPALTLADVKRILAAAEAEGIRNKWNVAIAVLDDGGHLLGFHRLDGATPANAEIAVWTPCPGAERSRLAGSRPLATGVQPCRLLTADSRIRGGRCLVHSACARCLEYARAPRVCYTNS